MTWFIMQPMDRYTPRELAAMKAHSESQLGHPYMLRGWWKGHEVRGIFCSELVADIIEWSGKIESGHIRESPGSLHAKLRAVAQGAQRSKRRAGGARCCSLRGAGPGHAPA